MLKDVLIVGVSAGLGGWIVGKYGASIESQFLKIGLPANIGHVVVVGGGAALVYYVLRQVT